MGITMPMLNTLIFKRKPERMAARTSFSPMAQRVSTVFADVDRFQMAKCGQKHS
jgi:hypothetical protein